MVEKTKTEIKEKFVEKEYPIHLIGRHVDVTDPMKAYAVEKLTNTKRFGLRLMEATIVMDIQKLIHSVDFIVYVNNVKIKVTGRTQNMYASIDEAIEHLEHKLSRYIRRIHEHNAKGLSEIDMNVNVIERITLLEEINDQIEEENLTEVEEKLHPHKIVDSEKRSLKMLNQEEAIMKMELSEDHFLIYRGEEDQKLKVIYRRNDNHYGIIEPEK